MSKAKTKTARWMRRVMHGGIWALVLFSVGVFFNFGVGDAAMFGALPGFMMGFLLGPGTLEFLLSFSPG